MAKNDIFLFSSNQKEGWGVVVNEAMNNKCCVVASDMIGSVPFLISDGYNGMVFKNQSEDSFYEKVKYLIDNPTDRIRMAEKGYKDLINFWSPKQVAANLVTLIKIFKTDKIHQLKWVLVQVRNK